MADQTVRTIYQANVQQAQRSMTNLAKDTDKAADSADKLDSALDKAGKKTVKPKIDVDIQAAEKDVLKLTKELDELEKLDADVRVEADVEAARGDLAKAEAELKALQGAKAEMVVTVDADGVDLDGVGDAAEDAGDDAGKRAGAAILDGLSSTPIVGAVAGIVAAVGIGAIAGIKVGLDAIRMEDVFGARLGLDDAQARKFGAAAGEAYSSAWGESIQDNLGTAQSALENALILPDSTGREIQGVIEQLTAVSEILGSDITETAEAAGNMIKNGLAKDATEAFDIIVTGQQNGMNRSEDWLDTLREYSGMFESIGLSGAEAGGLIEQAMDAGARNSDVAADALKEFSIRAQDDSKATNKAFEGLGLNADKMGKAIAKGGDTAKEGLDTVLDALRGVTDEQKRNELGVALFGTMWEDMGNGAGVLAMDLDDLGDSWVNVGDTAQDAMDRMSDNAATKLESAKRDIATAVTTTLGGLASTLEDEIGAVGDFVTENSAAVLGFLIDLGYGFFDLARAAVEFGATSVEVMGDVAGGLDVVVEGVGQAIEAIGYLTLDEGMVELGKGIQDAADEMTEFSENADGMADTMRTEVGGALDEAERKFTQWTGPALMQAEINDAVTAMVGRLDEFVAYVDGLPGGTITINGVATEGEEALNKLLTEVDESNGTVTINGETVAVEDAMDRVMQLGSQGILIEVSANTGPTEQQITDLIADMQAVARESTGVTVPVDADTSPAQEEVTIWGSQVGDAGPVYVPVSADTLFAEDQVETFYQTMMGQDWTIDVNGETVDAEESLGILIDEINAGEGTVVINGTPVTAESSLLQLIDIINASGGVVTIDGDAGKAWGKTDDAVEHANNSEGTIDVNANTSSANNAINNAARDRYSTIHVTTDYVNPYRPSSQRQIGFARGGQVPGYGSAYSSGYGIVPGPSAPYGVDNVLWPSYAPVAEGRATGGPILSQPLAGGEWVVNPVSSKQHDSLLAAINAGATRSQIAAMAGGGRSAGSVSVSQQISGLNAYEVARESEAQMRHVLRDAVPTLTR